MKSFMEAGPVPMVFDQKYGSRWHGICYASVIICSNHSDGFILDKTDRRVKRIQNTLMRRDNAYFVELNAWMQTDWTTSVWRYLQAYDIGDYTGTEPQGESLSAHEHDDRLSTQSPIQVALQLSEEYFKQFGGIFRTPMVLEAMEREQLSLGLMDLRSWRNVTKQEIQRASKRPVGASGASFAVRLDGTPVGFRVFACPEGVAYLNNVAGGDYGTDYAREQLEASSVDGLVAHIRNRLADLE